MIQNTNTMGTGDGKQNKILFPILSRIILLLLTQIVLLAGVDMDNNEKKTVTLNDILVWGVAKRYVQQLMT